MEKFFLKGNNMEKFFLKCSVCGIHVGVTRQEAKVIEQGLQAIEGRMACVRCGGKLEIQKGKVPTFTLDEALLLCAALNGVRCIPDTLYANIYNSEELAVASQWHVDPAVLLNHIAALSTEEKQAVIDAINDRVWGEELPYHTEHLEARIHASGLVNGIVETGYSEGDI